MRLAVYKMSISFTFSLLEAGVCAVSLLSVRLSSTSPPPSRVLLCLKTGLSGTVQDCIGACLGVLILLPQFLECQITGTYQHTLVVFISYILFFSHTIHENHSFPTQHLSPPPSPQIYFYFTSLQKEIRPCRDTC